VLEETLSEQRSLAEIAENLRQSEAGIWVAGSREELSYPDDAREWLFSLEEDSWWFHHRNSVICSLARAFPPAGEIFDVGGGNGVVSLALQRAGFPVVLLEPGAAGARNARKRGLPDVVCSTLQAAGFRSGSFPAAGLFDVIEHIEDDVGFLRELGRCVAPAGRIYVSVPAHAWLWSAEDEYAGHQRRYSEASLRETFARAGLRVEYLTFIFALLPLPMFLLRRATSLLGRSQTPGSRVEGHLKIQSGWKTWLLERAEGLEARRVAARRRVPFGASILAVVQNKPAS